MFDILLRLQKELGGYVELPALLNGVMEAHPSVEGSRGALDKWVRRNTDWLSSATNSEYVKGESRKQPGVFRTKTVSE